jgi:hypothetical protein
MNIVKILESRQRSRCDPEIAKLDKTGLSLVQPVTLQKFVFDE